MGADAWPGGQPENFSTDYLCPLRGPGVALAPRVARDLTGVVRLVGGKVG